VVEAVARKLGARQQNARKPVGPALLKTCTGCVYLKHLARPRHAPLPVSRRLGAVHRPQLQPAASSLFIDWCTRHHADTSPHRSVSPLLGSRTDALPACSSPLLSVFRETDLNSPDINPRH